MAILVLWASPNLDGLTAKAKDRVVAGIEAAGKEVEVVHLNGREIDRCRICGDGWGICRTKGACIIKDDFADIYRRMVEAEGIVWVTPVYWHDLAEHVKSYIDRLRRCEASHNHFLEGKANLLIACAGGTGNGAVQCLDKLETSLKHMGMVAVERLPVIQFNRAYMLPALEGAGKAFGAYFG